MIRLELFCDDAKLGRVVHALTGLLLQPPVIQPVANAQAKGGKVTAKIKGADRLHMLAETLIAEHVREVTPADIKAFGVAHGLSEKSYHGMLLMPAVKAGLLKKKPGTKGNKVSYLVTPNKMKGGK